MTLAKALAMAGALGLDRLDAQLLLLQALGCRAAGRAWLLTHDTDLLEEAAYALFSSFVQRRAAGEPLAYIVGHKEFFGLDLLVDKRVLVPRPDTETLVEWAIELLRGGWRAIDLGTGSAAIALALKKAVPQATLEAVDLSADALAVARENSRRLSLEVDLRQGSWLDGNATRYDLIVGNPPYVAETDPHLRALEYEPIQALVAGPDGLKHIRAIAAQASAHLHPGGWLLLEHGYDQAKAVRALLAETGFKAVGSRRDIAGIERCSGGQWFELG